MSITMRGREKREIKNIEFTPKTMSQLNLLPGAVSEILVSANETGVLTLADRYGLLAATLDENLDEEERRAINRLLQAVRRERVKIVDDISVAA